MSKETSSAVSLRSVGRRVEQSNRLGRRQLKIPGSSLFSLSWHHRSTQHRRRGASWVHRLRSARESTTINEPRFLCHARQAPITFLPWLDILLTAQTRFTIIYHRRRMTRAFGTLIHLLWILISHQLLWIRLLFSFTTPLATQIHQVDKVLWTHYFIII